MPHRHGLRTVLLLTAAVAAAPACGKKGLEGPEAEVKPATTKIDLPAVPDFALPPSPGEGMHSVKELRVKGKKLLDTDVTVKGVITWVYDCATLLKTGTMTDKDVQKMIDDDPTKCERAKFFVGDTKDTPLEKSLWVVGVPRPFTPLERKNGGKDELKNPPADKCDDKDPKGKLYCPVYAVGDTVTVTGKFSLSSEHSEHNSDGLVIFKKMKNETQNYETPPFDPTAPVPGGDPNAAAAAGAKPSPEDITKKKP